MKATYIRRYENRSVLTFSFELNKRCVVVTVMNFIQCRVNMNTEFPICTNYTNIYSYLDPTLCGCWFVFTQLIINKFQ